LTPAGRSPGFPECQQTFASELFDSGRARAAEAGVEIEWVEGEAMDLPYEDGRFDALLSSLGAMFPPVHARAAAELSRVAKSDGVVVMTTWAADHMNGRLFVAMSPFMPPLPDGVEPPSVCGGEEHVRAVFAPTGRSVTVERDASPVEFTSLADYLDFMSAVVGPVALNRPRLEQEGRFDDLRAAMREVFASSNEADDGSFRPRPQYLAVTAR
jgi:SAM-dependent methyltransferase